MSESDRYDSRSIVEATVTQLLVDSLADARHVLLTEQQRLLHRETTAVLTERKDSEGKMIKFPY